MTGASIDSVIESFERQRRRQSHARLGDYLPAQDSREYQTILTELIRVDMEFSWSEGQPRPLESYLEEYPQLRSDASALEAIAYEEYRLKLQSGETPSAAEYHRRYRINTRDWPVCEDTALTGDLPTLRYSDVALQVDNNNKISESSYPPVGESFLDFQLERELGQGAFGKVYLARQKVLANRQVVLKLTSRRQQEPQKLARLRHTNIMPIYSLHEWGKWQVICMPYLGKTTLADVFQALHSEKKMPTSSSWWTLLVPGAKIAPKQSYNDLALGLAEKLAAGLAHAHEQGIIHRDIKPANILLSEDGEPLLLDFNLAIDIHNESNLAALAGTLPYLSPEQLTSLLHGQATAGTPQADVYALGLVLYELFSGQSAFSEVREESMLNYLAALVNQRRQALPVPNLCQSPALSSIVGKCLAVRIEDRYQDAGQLAEDLRRQRENRPLRFAPEKSLVERGAKWHRRHPVILRNTLVSLIALLVLVAGISLYQRQQLDRRMEATQLFKRMQSDLLRAERLATTIKPKQLDEAARLTQSVIQTGKLVGYLPGEESRQHPVVMARSWLLLARLKELQAHIARDTKSTEELHAEALDANGNAIEWCNLLRQPQLATWQRSILTQAKVDTILQAIQNTPREQLAAKELAALAYTFLDQQRWAEAAGLSELILERDPGWSGGWFLYGLVQVRGGQLLRGLHGFETALALEPGDFTALHYRAKVRLQLGELEAARLDFDKALELEPRHADLLADQAILFLQMRDAAQAEKNLNLALEVEPDSVRYHAMRQQARTLLGNTSGATADQAKVLALQPIDELDYITQGLAYRAQGKLEQSLASFEAAERLVPHSMPALENQSELWGEQWNKPLKAVEVLDRAIARIPASSLLHASRAVQLARLGQRDKAISDVVAVLRFDQSPKPLTLYQIGCVYALCNKTKTSDLYQALAYLTLALERGFGKEYLASDPDLNPIRQAPEFQALLKRYVK